MDIELKPVKQKVWRAGNALVITIDSALCQALGIKEGDYIWTKIEEIEKATNSIIEREKQTKTEIKIKSGENVIIELPESREFGNTPTWKEFRLIPIYKRMRHYFPGYKIPFEVETELGIIDMHATSARKGTPRGDQKGGYYLKGKGLTKWFDKHNELKPGDKLIFTNIEPYKKYKLSIEK